MKRLFMAAAPAAALLLLCGCTRRVYVPVESSSVRTDSVRLEKWRTDTVLMRDSVVISAVGDTVTREIWRLRERVSSNGDACSRIVADTVVRTIPVEIEVEKRVEVPAKLSLSQKALISLGNFFLPILIALIILIVILKIKKR